MSDDAHAHNDCQSLHTEKQRNEAILQEIIWELSKLNVSGQLENLQLLEQIQQLTQALSQTNMALNAQLTELQETRDRAVDSNKAKSAFIANVSRQLRSPLDAIIGYSTLILENKGGNIEEMQGDLQQVNSGAGQLLNIINDILELSELESGQRPVNIDAFVMHDFLHDIITTAERFAHINHNRLVTHIADDLGVMSSDMKKLRQAILHILKNAAKFTSDGVIQLNVSSTQRDGQRWYLFEVSDTGIGIAGENFEHLFDPFIQEPTTNPYILQGSGIGLAITKHYCALLQGCCQVESTAGKGSIFKLEFPSHESTDISPQTLDT